MASKERVAGGEKGEKGEKGGKRAEDRIADCGLRIADFQKKEKKRFHCGSGFPRPEPVEGQPRSCGFNGLKDFNGFFNDSTN